MNTREVGVSITANFVNDPPWDFKWREEEQSRGDRAGTSSLLDGESP
jgi:hypothetical protein